ncbi:MAG: hypothetical protein ACTHJ0_02520 [Flavipsychrobacter sp.]
MKRKQIHKDKKSRIFKRMRKVNPMPAISKKFHRLIWRAGNRAGSEGRQEERESERERRGDRRSGEGSGREKGKCPIIGRFFVLGGFGVISGLKCLLLLSYDDNSKSNIATQKLPKMLQNVAF